MRVVWISAGLLVTFIVVLVMLYEPESDQSPQLATENPGIINPFVEEKPDAGKSEGSAGVELAKLPNDAIADQGAELQSDTGSPQSSQPGQAPAAEIATTKTRLTTPAEVAADKSTDINVNADNVDSLVVAQPKQPEGEEKKLGLAMIALEKENNKDKVAVIVHQSNTQQLTEKEIKALYLDRLTRWQDGSKVMLFDLPLGDKYRDKFSKSILKMTALEADLQETKRRELRIKANDVEVKAKNVVVSYVEQNPSAVAYVPLNLVREKSNVKVILTIP